MHEAAVDLAACSNCQAALDGPFCARCGQKAAPLNPSLGEFLHELFHEIAHVDGKIIQSVKLLLLKPGFLSAEQFAGRRARYVTPIRLYLVFSVLFFAVATFAPPRSARLSCTGCPPDQKAEIEATMREAVSHWTPRAMFVLVPVLAGLIALAARQSGRNCPQRLYFALQVHAVWFLLLALGALAGTFGEAVDRVVGPVALALAVAYFMVAFRRAYRTSIARAVVAPLIVTVIYVFTVGATL